MTLENGSSAKLFGNTTWVAGNITIQNNSTITNFGSWTTTCDQKLIGQPGCSFLNPGAFSKSNTTGQTNLLIAFSNAQVQGTQSNPIVAANSGTIEFTTSANQTGQFSTGNAGILLFDSGTQTFTEVTVHPFSQTQLRCGLFHSISAWSSRAAPDAESVML